MANKSNDLCNDTRRAALKELYPDAFDGAHLNLGRLMDILASEQKTIVEPSILNWSGKASAFQLSQATPTGLLQLQEGQGFQEDRARHLMIEGDNLPVLKQLRQTHRNRVKLIYIDPPYNTGKDFIYTDSFEHKTAAVDGGDPSRSWLSFMYPRLLLAKDLMMQTGVLFMSIDDNAFGALTLMADEIFGAENRITTFVWRRSGAGGLRGNFPVTVHEYILCYTKDKSAHHKKWYAPYSKESAKAFVHLDEGGRFKTQALYLSTLKAGNNQRYPIELPDGTAAWPPSKGVWRFIESTFLEKQKQGGILFLKSPSSPLVTASGDRVAYNIYTKQYLDDNGSNPPSLLPEDLVGQTRKAKAELKKVFGAAVFDYPKPVALLKYLLKLVPYDDDDICLDFFAGSGSTCQAVFELNADSEAQLQMIAVQSAEAIPAKHIAVQHGFSVISDITVERMRRALAGTEHGFKVMRYCPDER